MSHEAHPGGSQESVPPRLVESTHDVMADILASRGIGMVRFTHEGTGRFAGTTQSYDQLDKEGKPNGAPAWGADVPGEDLKAAHEAAKADIWATRGDHDGVQYTTRDGRFVPREDWLTGHPEAPALAQSRPDIDGNRVRISPRSTNTEYKPRKLEAAGDAVRETAAVRGLAKAIRAGKHKLGIKGGH